MAFMFLVLLPHCLRELERDRERQTDRQSERQKDRERERQTNRVRERQTNRVRDRYTEIYGSDGGDSELERRKETFYLTTDSTHICLRL